MDYHEAETLARQLMAEFECPTDFYFKWSNGKRQLGCAVYRSTGGGELRLSRYLVEMNDFDEVNDVIRHEIAHIKAGHKAGHNYVWKAWAIRCGARTERLNRTANVVASNYHIICTVCDRKLGERLRKPRKDFSRSYCRHCGVSDSMGKIGIKRVA